MQSGSYELETYPCRIEMHDEVRCTLGLMREMLLSFIERKTIGSLINIFASFERRTDFDTGCIPYEIQEILWFKAKFYRSPCYGQALQ